MKLKFMSQGLKFNLKIFQDFIWFDRSCGRHLSRSDIGSLIEIKTILRLKLN